MLKHVVLFKFKDSEDKFVQMQQIKIKLENLVDCIDELKSMEVGININPQESWDLTLSCCVETMEDLDKYSNHPAHIKVAKELIAPIKLDRSCVDFLF